MADKNGRIHIYLNEFSNAILEQLKTATGDSMSSIINQIIIDRGIQEGIITLEEVRDSIYSERKLEYKYSSQQTKFENMLTSARREIAEFNDINNKEISRLKHSISDIDKSVYIIKDMLNSMLCFTQEENASEFRSADDKANNSHTHLFGKMSEQNYQTMQERFAVEKANDAQRIYIRKEDKK